MNSFATLVTRTQMHLCRSETTAEDFKRLFIEREMIELDRRIKSTDTIPMMLDKVKQGNYWSFFNYELLASIIKCFCRETHLITELDEYVSEFKNYCQRRISEVPHGSLCGEQPQSTFKVKLDDTFHVERIKLQKLKDIQYQLEQILKMEPLQLVNVEKGCIELTFRYFNNAISRLFPLKEAEMVALSKLGVRWLCCDKNEVVLKTFSAAASAPTIDYTNQPSSSKPTTSSVCYQTALQQHSRSSAAAVSVTDSTGN